MLEAGTYSDVSLDSNKPNASDTRPGRVLGQVVLPEKHFYW